MLAALQESVWCHAWAHQPAPATEPDAPRSHLSSSHNPPAPDDPESIYVSGTASKRRAARTNGIAVLAERADAPGDARRERLVPRAQLHQQRRRPPARAPSPVGFPGPYHTALRKPGWHSTSLAGIPQAWLAFRKPGERQCVTLRSSQEPCCARGRTCAEGCTLLAVRAQQARHTAATLRGRGHRAPRCARPVLCDEALQRRARGVERVQDRQHGPHGGCHACPRQAAPLACRPTEARYGRGRQLLHAVDAQVSHVSLQEKDVRSDARPLLTRQAWAARTASATHIVPAPYVYASTVNREGGSVGPAQHTTGARSTCRLRPSLRRGHTART